MVVVHNCIRHSHEAESDCLAMSISHHHLDAHEFHDEHSFHHGIFHFLGHLFENIGHSNDHACTHIIVAQTAPAKKHIEFNQSTKLFFGEDPVRFCLLETDSLVDSPFYQLFLSQRINQSNMPLRAPPARV